MRFEKPSVNLVNLRIDMRMVRLCLSVNDVDICAGSGVPVMR